MPLPSQSARPKSRRSHMYSRRRRHGLRRLGIVALLTAGAVGIWWFWPDSGSTNSDTQNPSQQAGATNVDDDANQPDKDALVSRDALTNPVEKSERQDTAASRNRPNENTATRPPMASVTSTLVMGEPMPATINDPPATGALQQPKTDERLDADAQRRDVAVEERSADIAPRRPTDTPTIPTGNSAVDQLIREAVDNLQTQPIESRRTLSQALQSPQVSETQKRSIRQTLMELNEMLVFSPTIVPGDPFAIAYTVQSGDYLQKIVRTTSVQTDWRFAARINRIDPKRIRPGQRLKLITGPFHAIVHKSEYRLDLYLGDGPQQVFVRSFDVGLGQYNSTPEGLFRVRPRSKAVNPAWVNPRTGEAYDANDPENPIGEYWLGLEGVDKALADVIGYGIHGTTEPQSIGQQASMGCIRLGDDDVELIYEMLVEEASLVRIVP